MLFVVTMPSFEAQAALIKHVYESHGLDFSSTQYVEAHGTGTKAGDPIEAEAIYTTIGGAGSRKQKLWMGSLKPNVRFLWGPALRVQTNADTLYRLAILSLLPV